ncbi:hypothetical protein SKAU_G00083390 [Synaphobranchus kaupii]|uniref:Disks large homologue 1 N-terminal PEST domain-containing protein n=1 Tax=Synaphobranchus kaupii TaxID=118154 RepID=A0A9Q1J5Q8_SYNKA|nr:hypothetical protein SKAU_G00083390 [Synaphobranchus kaupii]
MLPHVNRPPAVQGCPHPPQPVCMHPGCMHPALMNAPWYQYQEEDMLPQDHGYPRLTHEVQPPELLHVTDNTPDGDTMHGYASHSHISPLKHSVTRCDLTYPSLTGANYMASLNYYLQNILPCDCERLFCTPLASMRLPLCFTDVL